MDFVSILSIFVLACFVGYYALIATAEADSSVAKWLGLTGVVLASVNIFGGFAVTERMLAMYKKKEKK
jgi:NAD(P) transhydrogenase subunit alpha